MSVYITAERLAAALRWAKPPVVLDVRWTLADPDGLPAFNAGHIPDARYVDLETELAGPAEPDTGRHPLPDIADLQAAARGWGLNDGDAVVCYDDYGGAAAARAWWLLRWAGVQDVRILDGGLRAWLGHSDMVVTDFRRRASKHKRGRITLTPGHMPTIDADTAATFDGVLVDARSAQRYEGRLEPMDPQAGHIPGAVNVPYTDTLTPDGLLQRVDQLVRTFSGAGVPIPADVQVPVIDGVPAWTPPTDPEASRPVAVYCGSGVTAAHDIATLASLGVPASLYPGSWSQWSADPDRPVATGPRP